MNNLKKGFIPVMLTPFKRDGEVDYDALTRLTNFYLKAGAKGLFANCLSSEMYELSQKERLKIVRHVIQIAGGEVPVVATGNFGNSIAEQADSVKQMYDAGVQAVILITSLLAGINESAKIFEDRVYHLMDLTPQIPLGFYECPKPYKRILSPEQLGEFVSTGRVIYHKDTCLDIEDIKRKLEAVKEFDFGLYDAYMGHAVASLKAGASGLSCIQGNFFPELIVWLCENYDVPSLQEQVEKVQQFFIQNMNVMHHVYPVVAKYFLKKRDFKISSFSRRQVGIYTTFVGSDLDDLQRKYNNLQEEIGIINAMV